MRKLSLAVTVSLVLAAGLAFAPRLAVAGNHFHRGFHGGSAFVSRPFFPQRFFVSPVFVRPFVPFAVVAAPLVVRAPAVVYAPPSVAYFTPPPTSTVIQYPHGRYELRGDGVTTPYMWVWIPNPPPPPPAPPA
jgi:hypothetical protein